MKLNLSIKEKLSTVIIASIAISMGAFFGVQAAGYTGTIFGLTSWKGYFKGVVDQYNGTSVLAGGIPGSINDANDFMYFIQTTHYKNGGTQGKVGAAFIVNTMLGRDAPGLGATVSDEDWAKFFSILKEREQAEKLTFNTYLTNAGDGINSYYQKDQQDDAFYSEERSGSGMQIVNDDGTTYQILNACANPIGELTPIVIKTWNADANASVVATALPGETVVWTHKAWITNGVSDKAVTYSWQNSAGFSAGSGVLGVLSAPTNPGVGLTGASSYVVQVGDMGKKLCRKTIATPRSGTDGSTVSSPDACVSIGSTAASGSCRPIKISASDPKWGSSRGKSYNTVTGARSGSPAGNELITVSVRVYKLSSAGTKTGGAVFSKSVTNGEEITDIVLTTKCTTGDKYVVEYSTSSYTYETVGTPHPDPHNCGHYHNKSCSGYPYTTWVGLKRSDSWTTEFGPCFDYLLKPNVLPLSKYQIEVDSSIVITPTIATDSWTKNKLNTFWTTYRTQSKSKVSQWQVSKISVKPNVAIPVLAASNASTDPCTYYKSKGFDKCTSLGGGNDTVFNNNGILSGSNAISPITNVITDEPAGSKICYVFSVRSADSEASNDSFTPSGIWSHSATATNYCVIIVKKPKVQVLGGDLSVGKSSASNGNVATTTSIKNFGSSYVFGSWAEYGVFAKGSISGLASAAAFNGGMLGSSISSNCQYSRLSFNNRCNGTTSTSSSVGNYNFGTQTIPDVSSAFPVDSLTPVLSSSVSVDYFNSNSNKVFTSGGNLTITGGELNSGKWAVINSPNATVTIAGDIKYTTDALKGISEIPQLVIIARDINITNAASQVDAWLVAKNGSINTCSDVSTTANLTAGMCRAPLTVNGPVVAKNLYLRRTFGSDPGMSMSAVPAEKLNLRADAYLWSYARSTGTGKVWTVYNTNVPPRL